MDRVGKFDHKRVWNQVGTLGGGNHFVELCLDESDAVWIMLHSGSRNVGKTIGETAIGMAREMAVKQHRHLPDRDLAWLDEGSPEFDEYVEGLRWSQDYAAHNRNLMLHAVLKSLREEFGREIGTSEHAVNCHHNYSSLEEHFGEQVWITRKGAVSARAGELGIIPGSMGARSFIVRGKGNADFVQLVLARRGASFVAQRGQAPVHARRSAQADRRRRMPQGRGRARRNPGRVQGHRRSDGCAGRSGRSRAHAEADHVHQGLDVVVVVNTRFRGRLAAYNSRCNV